jgi:hypothetical protein
MLLVAGHASEKSPAHNLGGEGQALALEVVER